jgi:hypothetical protein
LYDMTTFPWHDYHDHAEKLHIVPFLPWNALKRGTSWRVPWSLRKGFVIRRRGWCVGRGWVLAGEKEVDFTRKILPRLAILRALIRRDLRSDWSNSLDFGVVIRQPRCRATKAFWGQSILMLAL